MRMQMNYWISPALSQREGRPWILLPMLRSIRPVLPSSKWSWPMAVAVALLLGACGGGNDGGLPRIYTLRDVAVGETRLIPREQMSVEMTGVNASNCPPAAKCPTLEPGVFLVVRQGETSRTLTVLLEGIGEHVPPTFNGFQFLLDNLTPNPLENPVLAQQYRADITVRHLEP
jgi:hypothetical protein